MAIMPLPFIATALLSLLLGGCGGRMREPPSTDRQPSRAGTTTPRAAAPRPEVGAPSSRKATPPECDPRAGDPDRGRVGMGLLAGDCQDERGRNGAYVTRLVTVLGAPSPAQRAGIRVGDRLVRFDACEISSTSDVVARLRSAVPGWMARVVVERGGREVEVFVPTVKLPERAEAASTPQLSTAGCRAIGRLAGK